MTTLTCCPGVAWMRRHTTSRQEGSLGLVNVLLLLWQRRQRALRCHCQCVAGRLSIDLGRSHVPAGPRGLRQAAQLQRLRQHGQRQSPRHHGDDPGLTAPVRQPPCPAESLLLGSSHCCSAGHLLHAGAFLLSSACRTISLPLTGAPGPTLGSWVEEYHVDGFRFDLASCLCRDSTGRPLEAPPLIRAIAKDPLLSRVKLIAEPWDIGMYQAREGEQCGCVGWG